MVLKPSLIFFPEMALTLVRRASSKLPFNHYLFKTDPKWTKNEIKEYLQKIYGVKVARITTYVTQGKLRRVPGRRELYRTKTEKKVYVRIADESTTEAGTAAAAAAQLK